MADLENEALFSWEEEENLLQNPQAWLAESSQTCCPLLMPWEKVGPAPTQRRGVAGSRGAGHKEGEGGERLPPHGLSNPAGCLGSLCKDQQRETGESQVRIWLLCDFAFHVCKPRRGNSTLLPSFLRQPWKGCVATDRLGQDSDLN